MLLFVLTSKDKKTGEHPVGVVDNEKQADEWVKASRYNNWIPFELNDLSFADYPESVTSFRPEKEAPAETERKKREEAEATVAKLQGMVNKLTEANKTLLKRLHIKAPVVSSLLVNAHQAARDKRDIEKILKDLDGDTIEEKVATLMEKRSFNQDSTGDGYAIYSRGTEYEDTAVWLKVFFKDDKVVKVSMFDEEPERVINTRLGFEGVLSYASTFGD
jgi:hypothetical protein